jgi:tetratricopeptide (TPR) repeat protein
MNTTSGVVVDAETEAAEADVCCANCGIAGVDDIKLEECDDCDLVKYCSDKCREEHREQHEEECKNRKAELHDRKLFTQPDGTDLGECPICFLPMPIDPAKSIFWTCCSETICKGCAIANYKSNVRAQSCPFCRTRSSMGDEETRKRLVKRIKANDPAALRAMGLKYLNEGDYEGAFEYFTKAADLGDLEAHFKLGCMYGAEGKGVEKDEEKSIYHHEMAAIGGHPEARHNLAAIEEEHGNMKRSAKHLIIAAKLGYDESMKALWVYYSAGYITKEELEAALRTNKATIDATMSPQRKKADEVFHELHKK